MALQEEWEAIPQKEIHVLIDSIPGQLQAMIRACGIEMPYIDHYSYR